MLASVLFSIAFLATILGDHFWRLRDRRAARALAARVKQLETIIVAEARFERVLRGEAVKERETVEVLLGQLAARAEAECRAGRGN